jgi:putative endopeptidase
VKVGYPDKWRDYSSLAIKRDDLVGNVMRAREFAHQYGVNKLGKPVDRSEWSMTPQTVNAYYSPEMNEVVFPAARLQSPLYDADAEPAINYGAVGISIGHEISHAFDDQGAQYDGDGNLRNWWTKEDGEKFAAKGKVLVRSTAATARCRATPERRADAGREHRRQRRRHHGQPRLQDLAEGQAGAGDRRLHRRAAHLHGPGPGAARQGARRRPDLAGEVGSALAVGIPRQRQPAQPSGLYEAFDVKPGDKMYLAPEERVIFW